MIAKNPCQIKRGKREPVLLSVSELAAVADAIAPERFKALVLLSWPDPGWLILGV